MVHRKLKHNIVIPYRIELKPSVFTILMLFIIIRVNAIYIHK